MKSEENVLDHIIRYQGIDYLIFPDALIYTNIGASALHQKIAREIIVEPHVIQRKRYVFISIEKCNELKKEVLKKSREKKLRTLFNLNVSDEEIDKFIAKIENTEVKR